MPNSRKLIVQVLDDLTFFALYLGVFATVAFEITSSSMSLLFSILMIIPATINFFLRRLTTNLGKLILLHSIIPIVLVIVLPTQANTFLWVAISLWLALHSVIFAFRKTPTDTISFIVPAAFILGGLSVMDTMFSGTSIFTVAYPTLLCIAVLGRILLIRMIKMNNSLDAMHLSYKQPIDKIIMFDYKLIAGIVVAVIGISIIIFVLVIAPTSQLIWNNIPNAPELGSWSRGDLPPAQTPLTNQTDMPNPPVFRFWNILATVFFGITGVGLVIGAAYGIYRILLYISSRRYKRDQQESTPTDIQDEREFIRPRVKKQRKKALIAIAELHPIRRLFRDTAKKHVKIGVQIKKSDTPTDIATRIRSEDISTLAEEYAEVRYS